MIVGPTGEPISDIMSEDEGILYAEVDLSACVEPKQIHDVVGYYNRFDIFKLTVNRSANRPVTFEMGPTPRFAEPAAETGVGPEETSPKSSLSFEES